MHETLDIEVPLVDCELVVCTALDARMTEF